MSKGRCTCYRAQFQNKFTYADMKNHNKVETYLSTNIITLFLILSLYIGIYRNEKQQTTVLIPHFLHPNSLSIILYAHLGSTAKVSKLSSSKEGTNNLVPQFW